MWRFVGRENSSGVKKYEQWHETENGQGLCAEKRNEFFSSAGK